MELRQATQLLWEGKAVSQDLTNETQKYLGYDVPVIRPVEAGKNLANLIRQYDFTLFEYFQTDVAGHHRVREKAEFRLSQLDMFIGSFLANSNLDNTLVILNSDHGNIEDLSVKTHTKNKVPCLLVGKFQADRVKKLQSILDVAPMVEDLFL